MKEPAWSKASEKEVWEYVGWHLAKGGVETMLVGGAVCAIYSEGAYQSGDLDLIIRKGVEKKAFEILETLGFKRKSGRHFVNPKCSKYIEFVVGPPGVGDDIRIKPNAIEVKGLKLYIYSPTDCIRDRLASYIHFRARECLDQAALVANNYPFNRTKVREWCKAEGAESAYKELLAKLK